MCYHLLRSSPVIAKCVMLLATGVIDSVLRRFLESRKSVFEEQPHKTSLLVRDFTEESRDGEGRGTVNA